MNKIAYHCIKGVDKYVMPFFHRLVYVTNFVDQGKESSEAMTYETCINLALG